MPGRDGTGPLGSGHARFAGTRAGADRPIGPSGIGGVGGVDRFGQLDRFGKLGGLGRGGCYRGAFCAPLTSRYTSSDEIETLKAYRDLIDSRLDELTKATEDKDK